MQIAKRIVFAFVALGLFAACSWGADYTYDANGRLRGATSTTGDSTAYNEDALGNIISVLVSGPDTRRIVSFWPAQGPVGTTVKVFGTNFSTVTTDNVLKFAGTAATVIAATPTMLTCTVPAGAASGKLSIAQPDSSGGGSQRAMLSWDSFTVLPPGSSPPSILSFTPGTVNVGNTVTITGANFVPADGTAVWINSSVVPLSAITASSTTQIALVVPPTASTGKVAVSTPFGMATSAQDLVIAPAGTGSVVAPVRLAVAGASGALSIPAGANGMFLFDVTDAGWLSLQAQAPAAGVPFKLTAPGGVLTLAGTLSSSSPTIHFPRLAAQGTYALLLTPVAAATITAKIEKDPTLSMAAASGASVTTAVAHQSRRFILADGAGDDVGIAVNALTHALNSALDVVVTRPDLSELGSSPACPATNTGCELNLENLPYSGSYAVVVEPSGSATLNAMSLYAATDATYALVSNVATNVSAAVGQNARLTFNATAGQTLGLQLGNVTTTWPSSANVRVSVSDPAGNVIVAPASTQVSFINLPNLPSAGTYTVLLDPDQGAAFSAQAKLVSGAAGTLGNPPTHFATSAAGQLAYMRVEHATSTPPASFVGMAIKNLAFSPSSVLSATLSVFDVNGTPVTSTPCLAANGGCDLDLANTAASQPYLLTLSADGAATMSFDAGAFADAGFTIVPVSGSANVNLGLLGRNGHGTFTWNGINNNLRLQWTQGTSVVPTSGHVDVTVYNPGGTVIANATIVNFTGGSVDLPAGLAAGTYSIYVDPKFGATATNVILSLPLRF